MRGTTDGAAAAAESRKTVVGWRELIDLPEWGIGGVIAKIDTGARTCSLHVEDIEEIAPGRIRFHVILGQGESPRRIAAEADLVRMAAVRPSTGRVQQRRVVRTVVRLGAIDKVVEISLVGRRHMLCRMLIGRQALGADFLVDPERRYLFGRPPKEVRKRKEAAVSVSSKMTSKVTSKMASKGRAPREEKR